jgi:putative SOS response-associated peptidase YedK
MCGRITQHRSKRLYAEEIGWDMRDGLKWREFVTAAAEAGLVDVHDRRPVVLAPEDARLWMDHDFSAEPAEQLARAASLPPEAFEWYKVSTDINNARNNDEHLIERT